MKNNNELNTVEIRNTVLPLAVTKPNLYSKLFVVGSVVFYLMLVNSFLTNGFLTNYIYLEITLIGILLFLVSKIYDTLYLNTVGDIIDTESAGVVIGFSNKLLILTGEEVVEEIETDEIKIRSVNDSEDETFFSKYTSVLDCFKDGELVGSVGVDRLEHLEGAILTADMSRANEDMVVIYDDEDDELDDDITNIDGLDLD